MCRVIWAHILDACNAVALQGEASFGPAVYQPRAECACLAPGAEVLARARSSLKEIEARRALVANSPYEGAKGLVFFFLRRLHSRSCVNSCIYPACMPRGRISQDEDAWEVVAKHMGIGGTVASSMRVARHPKPRETEAGWPGWRCELRTRTLARFA